MSDTNIKFYKVASLPTSGYVVGGVYFCKADKKTYIRTSTGWEDFAGVVDSSLSSTSTNPVQNKVINSALSGKANTSHTHTKSEVGLGNVDNTADANKSVKYATSAGSATKDGGGNDIVSTYLKKTDFTSTDITVPDNTPSSIDYIKMGLSSDVCAANRFFGLDADQIIVEQTTDGGVTWTDYGASDSIKRNFFSGLNIAALYIPLKDGVKSLDCALRVTITGMKYNVPEGTAKTEKVNYWSSDYVNKTTHYFGGRGIFDIWLQNTGGTLDMIFEAQRGASGSAWTTIKKATNLLGWPGRDMIISSTVFGGYVLQTSNYWNWRFTFKLSALQDGDTYASCMCGIIGMKYYSASLWQHPYQLGKNNHLYTHDVNANANFPANVDAPTLSEGGTSLANKYAAKSHTHTKSQITDFPTSLKNPNAITIKGNSTELVSYDGSAAKTVNIAGSGAVTVSADASAGSIVVSSTDSKVTSVDNHYAPTGTTTKSASGGTVTDITNSSSGANVVTGVTMDAKGHVTGVTSVALKSTNTQTITGVKGSAESSFRTGNVSLTPANLGITVVNNTADANKSVASATKLTTNAAGSATKPVYFSNGIPVACSHSVEKDVPSNAVFTDTHHTSKTIIADSATATSALDATIENPCLNHIENGVVRSSIRIFGATRYSSDLSLPDGIYINSPSTVTTVANGLMLAEDKVKLDCFMAIDLYDLDLGVGDATSDTEVLSRMDGIMKNAREKQNGILLVFDASGGTTNVAKYPAAVLVSSYYSDTYYQVTIAIFKGTKVQTVGFLRTDTNITCTANNVFDLSRLSGTTTVSPSNSYLVTSTGVWNAVNAPSSTSSSSTSYSGTLTTTGNHRIMDIATTGTQTYTLPASPVNNETFVFYKIWSNSSLVIKSSTANMYNVKTASSSKTSSISFTSSSSPSRCKVTCVYCSGAWYVMPENLND